MESYRLADPSSSAAFRSRSFSVCFVWRSLYPGAYAEHLTWASILIFLLTHGAGPWSLDRLAGLESEETGRD